LIAAAEWWKLVRPALYQADANQNREKLMIGDRTLQFLARAMMVVTLCVFLAGQTSKPERKVESNVITSSRDPEARIELPKSAQYIGADRWILYDIADCELHVFVEADAQKNVQQIYWVQFESYLPSRPELRHTYDSPRHLQMNGMDFYVDTWVRGNDDSTTRGSDLEHILALIRGKGYKMPSGMMSVRLVHLLDEQKRKELMIIYSEDLAPTGFTTKQLQEGGSARGQWPGIEKGLIERACEKVKLQPPNTNASRPWAYVRSSTFISCGMSGGDDGTRTRGLCRDRAAF
jgi:hypothetical protein